MQRISVYIPDDTKKRITITAKAKSKEESEIIRQALSEGLKIIHPVSTSAKSLLELAKMAEQLPSKPNAPKDISTNLDYYAWGEPKKHE